jgi:anti-sigma factor RsiW
MKCAELEILICDYIDGTLDHAGRASVELHLSGCAACAELARDSAAAAAFLSKAEPLEVPAELVTRILYRAPGGADPAVPASQAARRRVGAGKWLKGWLEPVLQPRFAMGMAMTILSFSMVGRIAGLEQRQLRMEDLNPARVWAAIDDKLHRGYDRAVKYYENLRLVYEIQTRLQEWSAQEEELRRPTGTVIEAVEKARPSDGQEDKP